MKPAPLIPDFAGIAKETNVEFGRTPEFSFRMEPLTSSQIIAHVSCAFTSTDNLMVGGNRVNNPRLRAGERIGRLFAVWEFSRTEALIRRLQRVGFRAALFDEQDSLIQSESLTRTLDWKKCFPMLCLGTPLEFKDEREPYYPYAVFDEKGAHQRIAWRADGHNVVWCNLSILGIRI